MTEWVIDAREKECPVCERGPYKALGQHWAKSQSCSPHPFDDQIEQVIRGLLLGDASLEGASTPLLAISSTRERHIRWVHDQLGWLSRGVEQTDRGEYRVRTVAHEGFGRYLTWTGHNAAPSTGWELTPTAARCWYACDGGLSFTSPNATGQVTLPAQTDRQQRALSRLLARVGFSAVQWERRVALPRAETEQWLEWLGEPTPGSEYKWATSAIEYRALRKSSETAADYRTELYTAALEIARENVDGDGELSPDAFEDTIAAVEADEIAEWLGGGDWSDALSTAGIAEQRTKPDSYDRETLLNAFEQAAAETKSPLTRAKYKEWATDRDVPSAGTIQVRIGWTQAGDLLDVEVGSKGGPGGVKLYSDDELVEALRSAAEDIDGVVTQEKYDTWAKHNSVPSRGPIVRRIGWAEAADRAGVEVGSKGRTTETE